MNTFLSEYYFFYKQYGTLDSELSKMCILSRLEKILMINLVKFKT